MSSLAGFPSRHRFRVRRTFSVQDVDFGLYECRKWMMGIDVTFGLEWLEFLQIVLDSVP